MSEFPPDLIERCRVDALAAATQHAKLSDKIDAAIVETLRASGHKAIVSVLKYAVRNGWDDAVHKAAEEALKAAGER